MPLVVDSSVWIDYFNGCHTPGSNALDRALGADEIMIGDLILTEVLQGFRNKADFHKARELMSHFPIVAMLGSNMAIKIIFNLSSPNHR